MLINSKSIFIVILVLFSNVFAQQQIDTFFKNADLFFQKNVKNGRLNYEAIKTNPEKLNKLVDDVSEIPFSQLQEGKEEKAYLINVYNIMVVKAVLKHYPLTSVMEIGSFFDKDIIEISGEDLSLNEIEKDILYKKYPDPRLHFVLVCAAIGCPKIINGAYLPDKLGEQLNKRTQITLNDEKYVRIDQKNKNVHISELFKWYENDFTSGGMSVIGYINQFRDSQIPANYKISYITYDWKLNNLVEKKHKSMNKPQKSNLQVYTPSTLLKTGQIEIKWFNNLYSQTAYFDQENKKTDLNKRESYFTGIINSLYGITPAFNIGIDIYIKSVRNDNESDSPFSIFKFSSNDKSRTEFAQIGPKIKISPFKSMRNIAIQSTFLFAADSDLDGSKSDDTPYLDVDGKQWWTQVFYDYSLDNDILFYFESGAFFRFNSQFDDLITPLKLFLNYYPSGNWTIYIPVEFTSYWKRASVSAYYNQIGLGGKYQLSSAFELEILYTQFIFGKSQGAGITYNLGLRYII